MNFPKRVATIFWLVSLIFFLGVAIALAQDAVGFAGKVKKVNPGKSKVSLIVPETKKRFTLIIDDKTKLDGYDGIGSVTKGDAVSGKYFVNEKGLYMAIELKKQ